MFDLDGSLISREHVLHLLSILQIDPADQREVLLLPYPVEFPVVARALGRAGISLELLTDRMGGSP
jgi:hypothetical protein